jgi:hypothetical protein
MRTHTYRYGTIHLMPYRYSVRFNYINTSQEGVRQPCSRSTPKPPTSGFIKLIMREVEPYSAGSLQSLRQRQRPHAGERASRLRRVLAHTCRLGDNAGMARDDSKARLQLQLTLLAFDGIRPSGTPGWVSAVAPVVTQAAVGAGHWAAGRRPRALAAWACAAGSALAAWGLGTEAPTRAEMVKNTQQHRDLLRKLGTRLPRRRRLPPGRKHTSASDRRTPCPPLPAR